MKSIQKKSLMIKDCKARAVKLKAEIKELDLWFLKNISSKEWNDNITSYWLKQAKLEDLTDKIRHLTRTEKVPTYNTIHANINPNRK